MRDVRPFGSNTSKTTLPWWTTITSSSYARWPKTALTLSALIIPGLWLLRGLELPDKLADYRAYLKALEQDGLSQYAYVLSELQPVWSTTPPSPLVGRAAVLA